MAGQGKTAAEVYKARKIAGRVQEDMTLAMRFAALYERAAFEDEVPDYFNETPGVHGYNAVWFALLGELIHSLARMFDQTKIQSPFQI